MNKVGIAQATECQAGDVTALHLNLVNGIDALIEQVKGLIKNCRDLGALSDTAPFSNVELDVCLYDVSEGEAYGWKPKYHRLRYSPHKSEVYIVTQYVEGGWSSDSWLESKWIDLNKLLAHLEGLQQAA